MFTTDEMNAMIEAEGEIATAEKMALHQVDATIDLLNTFLEKNAGYRHPSVAIPYAVEILIMLITETIPPKDWEQMGEAVKKNIDEVLSMGAVPKNSDQEPDEFADTKEPEHGES